MDRLYDFHDDKKHIVNSSYFMNDSRSMEFESRYSQYLEEEDNEEYNYYTGSDDDDDSEFEDEFEISQTRRAIGAMSPIILTAGVGLLLAKQ